MSNSQLESLLSTSTTNFRNAAQYAILATRSLYLKWQLTDSVSCLTI
jgi:hypothetical protein